MNLPGRFITLSREIMRVLQTSTGHVRPALVIPHITPSDKDNDNESDKDKEEG